jgi:type VI secretion system secreted protein VgrG
MPDAITDAGRLLAVSSPALAGAGNPDGSDVLLVNSFSASEALSHMFRFDLTVMTQLFKVGQVSPEKLIGQGINISLELVDGTSRFFHGIVSQFVDVDENDAFRFYQLQVVPWLWLLTLNSDCRILQRLTVPDILKQVLKPFGPIRDDLHRDYTPWDYRVQYRETHFNFVSRLMEQEGIFYFFEHQKNKHTLVLSDSAQLLQFGEFQQNVRFAPDIGIGDREDVILSWQRSQLLTPGMTTLRDYHFELPKKKLEGTEFGLFSVGGNQAFEVYDFPGGYAAKFNDNTPARLVALESDEPGRFSEFHMEEEETPHETFIGDSICRGLEVGTRFDLDGHPSMSGPYLVKSLQHSVSQSPSHSNDQAVLSAYTNTVTCLSFGRIFRPNRTSLRPVVQGPQSAVVVGPDPNGGGDKEEIFTDQFGRVKVQFPWDRLGKENDNSSCWLRVAQSWAGAQWGAIFIPRVGHEVLVDFLEGDPDQPIVIGSLYNRANMPPYVLPDHKTQSGIKTRSVKKGTAANFNEIRFEDKKGQELFSIHAERDFSETVEANTTESVGGHRFLTVGTNQVEEVTAIKASFVGQSHVKVQVDNLFSITGGDRNEAVAANYVAEAQQSLELKGDQQLVLSSDTRISLIVGGSFIDITAEAITINAPMVMINSGGSPATQVGIKSPSQYGDDLAKFDTWSQFAPPDDADQGGGDDQ